MLSNQPVRTRQPRPIMTAIKNPCSCKGGGCASSQAHNPMGFASRGPGPSRVISSYECFYHPERCTMKFCLPMPTPSDPNAKHCTTISPQQRGLAANPVSVVGGGATVGPGGATGSGVSSGMNQGQFNNQFSFRVWNWPAWYYPTYAYPYYWPYPYAYAAPYSYPYPQPYAYPYQYAYGWSGWPGYYGAPWPYAPRAGVVV